MTDLKIAADKLNFNFLAPKDKNSGCWLWVGCLDNNGYGRLSRCDRVLYAHRMSYLKYNGEIPQNMEVCHRCDVKRCCNPDHLFLGTHSDNIKDMYSKGKGNTGGYTLPAFEGSKNPNAKLKEEDIDRIKDLFDEGYRQKYIAEMFNITQGHVSSIINNKKWKSKWRYKE